MKNNLKTALSTLKERGKSALAFNLQNFYQLEACAESAISLKTPTIIQFSERFLRFLDTSYGIPFMIERYRNDYTYFHLDHCIDLNFIKYCIDSGFDSVMYDGSAFSLKENITSTLEIKRYANKTGCLVEGELGKVSGVEDGFGEEGSSYAEIDEIVRYVNETQIDLMALGIGNAHGFYENLEGIDLSILEEASKKTDKHQFFVLHGGTGLPEEVIKSAIRMGVVKINVSTQIKKETADIMKNFASQNDLHNEISFHKTMVSGLGGVFRKYLNQYSI